MRFTGTLCVLDKPSDRAPGGSRGRRVLLTRSAAEQALPGLIGAPVTACAALDAHVGADHIGVVERAWIDGHSLEVEGTLHKQPMAFDGFLPRLGMSYELENAHIADMQASVWHITKATFTGLQSYCEIRPRIERRGSRYVSDDI